MDDDPNNFKLFVRNPEIQCSLECLSISSILTELEFGSPDLGFMRQDIKSPI